MKGRKVPFLPQASGHSIPTATDRCEQYVQVTAKFDVRGLLLSEIADCHEVRDGRWHPNLATS